MTAGREQHRVYQVLRQVSEGVFGAVLQARMLQTDGESKTVAIKLLHPEWSRSPEIAALMREENRLLRIIRHRNIAEVMTVTWMERRIAIVMEYVEGIDTEGLVAYLIERGRRMPAAAALQFVAQVASALEAAYNKAPVQGENPLRIIHRDVKPTNLLLDAQGVVKVTDFGLARVEMASRGTDLTDPSTGRVDYLGPERRRGEWGGETSDVYSLGAVLFELLTLNRLGSGKMLEAEHRAWVEQRLGVLSKRVIGPQDAIEQLAGILRAMVGFTEVERPRPGEVVSFLRQLARSFDDGHLEDWAIDVVHDAVQHRGQRSDLRSPLVGATLIEEQAPATRPSHDQPTDLPRAEWAAAPPRPALPPPPRSPTPSLPPEPEETNDPPSIEESRTQPKHVRVASPTRPPPEEAAPSLPPEAGTAPQPMREVKPRPRRQAPPSLNPGSTRPAPIEQPESAVGATPASVARPRYVPRRGTPPPSLSPGPGQGLSAHSAVDEEEADDPVSLTRVVDLAAPSVPGQSTPSSPSLAVMWGIAVGVLILGVGALIAAVFMIASI